jgi:hypothetical protein
MNPATDSPETDGKEHQCAQSQVDHVLRQDVDRVLGGVQAGFQNGKARLHEDHQYGTNEDEKVVERVSAQVGSFLDRSSGGCRRLLAKQGDGQGRQHQNQ